MTDKKKWVPKSDEAAREEGARLKERFDAANAADRPFRFFNSSRINVREATGLLKEPSEKSKLAVALEQTEEALGDLRFDLTDLRNPADDLGQYGQLSDTAFNAVVEQVAPTLNELAECAREAILVTLRIQQLEEERDEIQRQLEKLK